MDAPESPNDGNRRTAEKLGFKYAPELSSSELLRKLAEQSARVESGAAGSPSSNFGKYLQKCAAWIQSASLRSGAVGVSQAFRSAGM
jgi:hypothetical protein